MNDLNNNDSLYKTFFQRVKITSFLDLFMFTDAAFKHLGLFDIQDVQQQFVMLN